MLSSKSPLNALNPRYPDLPLSLRVQEMPRAFSEGEKEGVPLSASTTVVPLFTLLYVGVSLKISFGKRANNKKEV